MAEPLLDLRDAGPDFEGMGGRGPRKAWAQDILPVTGMIGEGCIALAGRLGGLGGRPS